VTVTKGEAIEAQISVDGDASDWQGVEPLAIDPEGDAPSKDEDMKAFYATNDSEYLYFLIEFYSDTPRSVCEFPIVTDLDGKEDFLITVKHDEVLQVLARQLSEETIIGEGQVVLGKVIEGKVPLKLIGSPKKLSINRIEIVTVVDGSGSVPDEWEGSLEVDIIPVRETSVSAPSLTPIPFPSTESLWKTTNGGITWERILTSNLKLWVDGEEIQVDTLESIALSDNFAEDNALFVYESGDEPKIWVSTDGGATFELQR